MSDTIFQIPSEISKVTSMARRSIRLQIDTEEGLSDDQMAKAMSLFEKRGWFTFSVETIKPEDLLNLPEMHFEKDEKSPSLRLRNCLFILYEQKGKPTETFEEFYRIQTERIINNVKNALV